MHIQRIESPSFPTFIPLEKIIKTKAPYGSSTLSGTKNSYTFSIFIQNFFSVIFRLFTYPFYSLFAKNTPLKGFYIPDLTEQKKKKYEDFLKKNTPARKTVFFRKSDPLKNQKIRLLHQINSFLEHLQEWRQTKNTESFSASIVMNGPGLSNIVVSNSDTSLSPFLEAFQKLEERKQTTIFIKFISRIYVDHGYGPYELHCSTLSLLNTLSSNGEMTTETIEKTMQSFPVLLGILANVIKPEVSHKK